MAVALYEASVGSFLRSLEAVAGILQKGAMHRDLNVDEIVDYCLADDMKPLSFQVLSVAHHSRGAIEGCLEGVFTPPPSLSDVSYTGLQEMVAEARAALSGVSEEAINELAGCPVIFRVGDFEMPFTAERFLLSFSLPNFYFHATTTYMILRQAGVPLGKMDFLGQLPVEN